MASANANASGNVKVKSMNAKMRQTGLGNQINIGVIYFIRTIAPIFLSI